MFFSFFFFNDTATTEIYTLSLHDALPIYVEQFVRAHEGHVRNVGALGGHGNQTVRGTHQRAVNGAPSPPRRLDRKSTRLNSSHSQISYAVFCLKKKKKNKTHNRHERNLSR